MAQCHTHVGCTPLSSPNAVSTLAESYIPVSGNAQAKRPNALVVGDEWHNAVNVIARYLCPLKNVCERTLNGLPSCLGTGLR